MIFFVCGIRKKESCVFSKDFDSFLTFSVIVVMIRNFADDQQNEQSTSHLKPLNAKRITHHSPQTIESEKKTTTYGCLKSRFWLGIGTIMWQG